MLKSFRTNFNKTNLLRSKYRFFIEFDRGQAVHFRVPTFGELYDKVEEIDATIYLMNANPKEFNELEMGFIAKNTYELFWGTLKLSPYYAEKITLFFNSYFEEEFDFKNDKIMLGNVEIDAERFDLIKLIFLISTGYKEFSEWVSITTNVIEKTKELDELSSSILQKMAKNNERIKKTKENQKSQ